MENLSNRFVSRTKSLITFSRNGITHEEKAKTGGRPEPVSKSSDANPVRIWIDIRISNGLHLSQKNLSYQDLVRMIEKLEGLC